VEFVHGFNMISEGPADKHGGPSGRLENLVNLA
jgi:hypothetical protein